MTSKRIVYTRPDRGVSVCCPSAGILAAMQTGGHWNGLPRGFVETQIERQIADGIEPDTARRYAHAVAFGGCTAGEAWDIIAERDCRRFGTGIDLVDLSDLPDRWFRDAWRRGHNGGPVEIDLTAAKSIQWKRLRIASKRHDEALEYELEPRSIVVPWGSIKDRISSASSVREIRRIWIEGLPNGPAD